MEIKGLVLMEDKQNMTLARVFSFDLKFTGTRKTLFYRKLFGYSSSTKRDLKDGSTKIYTHLTRGLLGAIPHVKLGKSVIAVPRVAAARLEAFFSDPKWQPMDVYSFDAVLPAEVRVRAMSEILAGPFVVGRERVKLDDEIDELLAAAGRGKLAPELAERARHVLRVVEEIVTLGWTDGSEFSRWLELRLAQLRRAI